MISRAVYPRRQGRRLLTAIAGLSLVTGVFVVDSGTALAFNHANFELDKNATHTLQSSHLGSLQTSITSTATTFSVCDLTNPLVNVFGTAVTTPFTIQIDAEQMTVTAISAANTKSTGGCSFSDPSLSATDTRTYTATRGVNGTTAAAHAGTTPRNEVTLIEPTTGNDWDQVYADHLANTGCGDIGAAACVWKNRPNTGTATAANGYTGPTTFTGTSGDTQTIAQWTWTNQSVPDADEINDAFAAKYTSPDQNLYVGMDRYAVNGSKDIGFWFFHEAISPNPDGSFSGAHCYAGQTTDGCTAPPRGDVLILTTFTAGGGTATARAYEWVGNGPGSATSSDGPLNFLGSFGDCVPGNSGDKGCATTSNSTVNSPWPHQEKPTGASANVFYAGGFMEGGLDLTQLGLTGCFASFMGTSRSSPSLTAQPKAFILGGFEACTSGLKTTPSVSGSHAIGSNGTLSVTDSAALSVGGASTWSGTLKFYLCGPIAANNPSQTCDGTTNVGTLIDTQSIDNTTTQPIVSAATSVSSAGFYCWRGAFTSNSSSIPDATDATSGECFTVTPLTPTIGTQVKKASDNSSVTAAIAIGTSVYDTATLSGGTSNATGTVNYSLYTDSSCTTLSTAPALNQNVTVAAGSVPNSNSVTFNHAGTFYFQATYVTGDANNVAGATSSCTSETVVVSPNTPTISTQLKKASDNSNVTAAVPIGAQVYDTATLSGATATAGGTVTYALYTNSTCTTLATTPALNQTVTVTNASVPQSNTLTFTQAGTYYFQATYNDDADNTGGAKSACNSEILVISPNTPQPHSLPVVQIKDTITVSGLTSDATGTVTVKLFSDNTCSTQVGSTASFPVSGSTFSQSTTFQAVLSGTYYYQVSYNGDNNNTGFTSTCTAESVGVNITSLP